jgi:hypothetical protein
MVFLHALLPQTVRTSCRTIDASDDLDKPTRVCRGRTHPVRTTPRPGTTARPEVVAGEGKRMKGWFPLALGLLAVIIGAVWTLQGLGYVGGSVMTGNRLWVVIGPIVLLLGLLSLGLGLRRRRRTPPS